MRKKYYKKRVCVDCGDAKIVLTSSQGIRCSSCANKISSIGRALANIVGVTFGLLTAVRIDHMKNNKAYWLCKCNCGNDHISDVAHLRNGDVKSCGCLYRSQDGKSKAKAYKSYASMMDRCYKKKLAHYARYGGNGIRVCDRWRHSYLDFLSDMGERPEGKTLDRIDSSGNYCKENCRWATVIEQARNKKNNKIISFNGKIATLAEWQPIVGISADTLSWRLINGWTIEEALTLPVSWKKRSNKFDKNVVPQENIQRTLSPTDDVVER